ncbi:hypothetical protein ACTGYW_00560 [Streptococcus suis]
MNYEEMQEMLQQTVATEGVENEETSTEDAASSIGNEFPDLPKSGKKFDYEIRQKILNFGANKAGWEKQLNLVSYDQKEPVFDIRRWSPNGNMSKGVTLNKQEFGMLCEYIIENQEFFKKFYN